MGTESQPEGEESLGEGSLREPWVAKLGGGIGQLVRSEIGAQGLVRTSWYRAVRSCGFWLGIGKILESDGPGSKRGRSSEVNVGSE